MVAEVMTSHGLSQRRACGLIGITRRTFRRAPGKDRNRLLRQRLRELAEERRRWGCPMLKLLKLYRLMHLFMRPAAISPPGELVVEHNVGSAGR
jgi:hypothetical protein